MKNAQNETIIQQGAKFAFAFLGRRENAPFTMSIILIVLMGWWNITQESGFSRERSNFNAIIFQRDSMAREERVSLYKQIGAQNAEILLCKTAYERLETEIKSLRREIKKR